MVPVYFLHKSYHFKHDSYKSNICQTSESEINIWGYPIESVARNVTRYQVPYNL